VNSMHEKSGPTRRRLLLSGTLAFGVPAMASAQTGGWQPSKPIRIIVSQAPGGSTDGTARAYADWFSEKLGVPVTVENRTGAMGMVAAGAVAHAAPDGYTLLVTLQSLMALAPVLLKAPPMDPDKDLAPIASMSAGPLVAVVHKDFPAKSISEVVVLAKKKPVNVGNYAVGSGWEMMVNQLAKDSAGDFNVVNYKGTALMQIDLYGGTIDMGAGSLAGMGGGLQKGLIKPILIISGPRSRALPGVPTWADEGFKGPAYEDLMESNMLYAPAGTPKAVIDTLASLVKASISESRAVKSIREILFAEDVPLAGVELKQVLARASLAYRSLVKSMKLGKE
jgi:tripartite-type tricarboxylate transporter receptor subunit TctC